MKHIYSADFKYVSSNDTDIRKTFARIRREQKAAAVAQAALEAEREAEIQAKVTQLKIKEKAK